MENKKFTFLPTIVIVFLISLSSILVHSEANTAADANKESGLETYIVFVDKIEPQAGVIPQSRDWDSYYQSFLPASNGILSSQRMLHLYRNVVSGFAAKLTAEEAKVMEEKYGVVSVRPEEVLPLHTTRSPNFLGLVQNNGNWKNSDLGKGVIIGVLDTGITPDHPSFSDHGMPPPPAKWKGKCELNGSTCNNKLIGARSFVFDVKTSQKLSPFDEEGHGTHTASTAAGSSVYGANVFRQAKGTAVGMAPMAHIAMYRVCTPFGCPESAILAAMDSAVEDGVDVLSLSLGGPSIPFYADSIAVGAFAAVQNGIFVSCSAGNSGPEYKSLSNEAPWILTVGASTIDRKIRTTVRLGNGQSFQGESVFQPEVSLEVLYPLVDAASKTGSQASAFCGPGTLKGLNVKGKIVLCQRGAGISRISKGVEVKNAGGVGMILTNDELSGYSTLADPHVLPASHVSYADGIKIKTYIDSATTPTGQITFQGTILGIQDVPSVTSFSSRGPNVQSPGVLKPDIIGPGVNILAAWPVSVENKTNTKATFNIVSGTSMSCPHLSGIAALLKGAHPDWSPAAIKSAIMTSAYTVNRLGRPIFDERSVPADVLATGAGHVQPSRAIDPGLVYDIQPDDYIPYLCGLGYTDRDISYMVQRKVKCIESSSVPDSELNYPSFSVVFGRTSQTYTRTVTNVGPANSMYTAEVYSPAGVTVYVYPEKLEFTYVKQKLKFYVSFTTSEGYKTERNFSQGSLVWVSQYQHFVRSPILVTF
ncbi:hypothetical protein K2173_018149 [Erythroxylum novogranatense]|uniref:Uncharacterized protein n=1 Tax=Erythroxylum novogranatense TaxID=1862640 RepID=A0AAV8TL20_9ROSI|nr:hypothetical protein K2173_018149 [Erythroxylum novogranatense]